MIRKLVLAAGIAAFAAPATAATYNFSFSNDDGGTAGTVSGTIELGDGDGVFAALAVFLNAFPAALGLGAAPVDTNATSAGTNSFTVAGGQVTDADYFGLIDGSTALALNSQGSTFLDKSGEAGFGATGVQDLDGSTLSISAVPLPASMPLLLAAFGGIALMRRRAK